MKKMFLALALMLTICVSAQVTGPKLTYAAVGNLLSTPTHAAGTVKPQGSVDGVNYVDIAGQTAFTLTDVASQTCAFVVTASPFQYYRVVVTPSGTQSTKIASLGLVRKY